MALVGQDADRKMRVVDVPDHSIPARIAPDDHRMTAGGVRRAPGSSHKVDDKGPRSLDTSRRYGRGHVTRGGVNGILEEFVLPALVLVFHPVAEKRRHG